MALISSMVLLRSADFDDFSCRHREPAADLETTARSARQRWKVGNEQSEMSTVQPDPSNLTGQVPPAPIGPAGKTIGGPDPLLVQETKTQIHGIVEEIVELSQSDVSVDEFFDEFLRHVVTALAAQGGAVWSINDSQLHLSHQINVAATGLLDDELARQRHDRLLRRVLAGGRSTLAAPHSTGTNEDEGNPTDSLLIIGVLHKGHDSNTVVEIFQRGGSGPTSQRGYLRFLTQMCDYANNFLKTKQIRNYVDREELWRELEQFIEQAHLSLDPRITSYSIANEACRVLKVDRVAVAWRRGRICRIAAISGVDSFDLRSEELKQLSELTSRVVAIRRPLWYTGSDKEIPPQIQESLHRYIDYSEAKTLGIVPLHRPGDDDQAAIAALIVESFREDDNATQLSQRINALTTHAASALSNSLEHQSLFLMPLWKAIGNWTWIARGRQLPKTLTVLLLLIATIASLFIITTDLEVEATGTLQPVYRRDVFTKVGGVVENVAVRNGDHVRRNQLLAQIVNTPLTVLIRDINGQIETIDQQLRAKEDMLLRNHRLDPDAQRRIDGEIRDLRTQQLSLHDQLALHLEQYDDLNIVSPIEGEVVSWQVERALRTRPVNIGETLMTIIDADGPWELELRLPERRLSHLTARIGRTRNNSPVPVTFVMASDPQAKYYGTVREVHRLAEQDPNEGTIVRVMVDFDRQQIAKLQYGTTVTARIECERRSLGFVIFQDLIETVHSQWLLWF
jgi:multidrug efflux pump subunit AcrA (membrane-fusion protein)